MKNINININPQKKENNSHLDATSALHVIIPSDLHYSIKILAWKKRVAVKELVINALEDYLARQESEK